MPNTKTGNSFWVPDIRPEKIEEFTEAGNEEALKAVDAHPILNKVLDKFGFFRTHASAVWYNQKSRKTVTDQFNAVTDMLSLRFSPDSTYDAGDYCLYWNGAFDGLYKFIKGKDAGEWDSDSVEQVSLANMLREHDADIATLSEQYSKLSKNVYVIQKRDFSEMSDNNGNINLYIDSTKNILIGVKANIFSWLVGNYSNRYYLVGIANGGAKVANQTISGTAYYIEIQE